MTAPDTAPEPGGFAALDGFAATDCRPALAALRLQAGTGARALRPALPPDANLLAVMDRAKALSVDLSADAARRFVEHHFVPRRVAGEAFVTGYYEPVIDGAPGPAPGFTAPLLGRPADLRTFAADEARPAALAGFSAAQVRPDGTLAPYPDRAAIEAAAEAGACRPLVWVRDWAEAFLVQVQGSARVRLPDGRRLRLTYAGRNGHPYTSIGRLLVEAGAMTATAASMDGLKAWLRANGQEAGQAGRRLMQRNASFIFFDAQPDDGEEGPVGGAGVPLRPFASIAVDRTRWPYGSLFWLDAMLPWRGATMEPFRRVVVAADTGSAIVGPARVDLFYGSGEEAGRLAGAVRHKGTLAVLLPRPGGEG